jgi:hypothetical protein
MEAWSFSETLITIYEGILVYYAMNYKTTVFKTIEGIKW